MNEDTVGVKGKTSPKTSLTSKNANITSCGSPNKKQIKQFIGSINSCPSGEQSANKESQKGVSANQWVRNKRALTWSKMRVWKLKRQGAHFKFMQSTSAFKLEKRSCKNVNIRSAIISRFPDLEGIAIIKSYVTDRRRVPYEMLMLLKQLSTQNRAKLGDFQAKQSSERIIGGVRTIYHLKKLSMLMNVNLNIVATDPSPIRGMKLEHPSFRVFENELKRIGDKPNSIRQIEISLRHFLLWLTKNYRDFIEFDMNTVPVWKINHEVLNDYKSYLLRTKSDGLISESAARFRFHHVMYWLSTLQKLGIISNSPANQHTNIRVEPYVYREIPTIKELREFFETIKQYSEDETEDIVIFSLMLTMGLRFSEVANLRSDDFNLDKGVVRFIGKGGGGVTMPIPTQLLKYISSYLQTKSPSTLLFGNSVATIKASIYHKYKIYSFLAGWNYPSGVHLLRHTFITYHSKLWKPNELMRLSRITTLYTLARYIHRSAGELHDVITKTPLI